VVVSLWMSSSASMSMCSDTNIVTAVYKTADCAGAPFSTTTAPLCKRVCVDNTHTAAHSVPSLPTRMHLLPVLHFV
jgi:hypothetical protein